ncbi:MAG: type II secretion system protein [Phycisphaerae bacterium]|nr:type II secretion system protein [Phycisphaerae bacterium]
MTRNCLTHSGTEGRKGFTLIELLVVISIIALLVSILMPVLGQARQKAYGAVCLGNQKSLILAWTMWSDENGGKLVGGTVSGAYNYNGWVGTEDAWCNMPKDDSGTYLQASVNITREQRFNGYRTGQLWQFLSDPEVYHCPGDKSENKNPRPYNFHRTYSISGMMRGEDAQPGHNRREAYIKNSQIKSPAGKLVFMEEDPYTRYAAQGQTGQWANYGSWVFNASSSSNTPSLWDGIAFWHNDRNTISFADGHAEVHTWEDKKTLEFTKGQMSNTIASQDNPDVLWLDRAYGGLR